jgi:soluble lytic murein transglycosylase
MKNLTQTVLIVLLFALVLSACQAQAPASEVDPTPTHTPDTSPTPEVLPTPTQQPELSPAVMISEGEKALFAGDTTTARTIFEDALSQSSDAGTLVESRLGLGRALYEQESYGLAKDQFEEASLSDDPVVAFRASYLLGQTYTQLERYDEALLAYETALQLRPDLIDSHIHSLRGNLLTTLENYEGAAQAYEAAFLTDPTGGTEAQAIDLAAATQNAGQVDTALDLYENIYATSNNDYTKAQMDLRIGQIYLDREQPEEAFPYLQDAVNNFPFAYDAFTALLLLLEAGQEVDEYQRGLINFSVGQHALAIEAFDRYLDSGAEANADGALYHKALATRSLDSEPVEENYQAAIDLWEGLILDYPTSSYYVDAWQDIEYTLWAFLGEPEAAAEHALSYVAQRPESAEAPDFLFLAGRSYERAGLLAEAAETWTRIADEYPNDEETFRATYFAGIARVRLGDWEGARSLFSRALVLTTEPAETAAAHLWIGKCQEAQGDISAALDSWKIAQTADPFGHYSIRAEDLLIGREPFSEPEVFTLDPDLAPYRMAAEDWLRTTFSLAPDENLESPGMLANDPRFQRGMAFWALGNYPAGRAAFEDLRQDLSGDPAQTFRLIPALVEIGLYRSALAASTDLLRSAGLEGAEALEAPEFFSRVRFGAYYLDWVLPVSDAEDISPLLLLSVMRQESSYEGFIESSAGARGLMQIIPSTGAQLADDLQWPEDYTAADLDRPYVSLVFGATYLRRQRGLFEGDPFAMLAAYNGGPGNTLAWVDLAPSNDPDLFLEVIRIEETRNYIRLINEIHSVYKWLYGEIAE